MDGRAPGHPQDRYRGVQNRITPQESSSRREFQFSDYPCGPPVPLGRHNPIHRSCSTRFPLFSSISRSGRPKLAGCRAIPVFRRGLMHYCLSPQTGAQNPHLARPDATRRRCSARLRHKILRDRRKPQKDAGLTLYEKFARVSQFASPLSFGVIRSARVPPLPSGHSMPRPATLDYSGGLPQRRESG